jgi:hypothetical protein
VIASVGDIIAGAMRRAAGIAVLLSSFLAGAGGAKGDNGTLVTLEWLVANSPLVVRGHVLPHGVGGRQATVEIDEVLKGSTSLRGVTLDFERVWLDPVESDPGAEVLLCLEHRPAIGVALAAGAELRGPAFILLKPDWLARMARRGVLLSMDLRPLLTADDVLATARSACALSPTPGFDTTDEVPLYKGPWARPLPLDPPVEPRAIFVPQGIAAERMARSLLLGSPRPEVRALAMEMLIRAGAPQYSVSLRSLLDDPSYQESGQGPWAVRRYLIRERAHEALSDAGIPVKRPVTEGTLARYGSPHWGRWGAVGLVSVLVLMLAGVRQRWRSNAVGAGLGVRFALALLLTCAVAYAWIASRRHAGELVITAGGARHRLASYRGGLQYMLIRDWPEPRGIATGSFPYDGDSPTVWQWDTPSTRSPPPPLTLALVGTSSMAYSQVATTLGRSTSFGSTANQVTVVLPSRPLTLTGSTTSFTYLMRSSVAGPYVKDRTPRSQWRRLGLMRVTGQLTGPDGATRSYVAIRVAYPWLAAPPLAMVLLSLASIRRRHRRIRLGLCARCGYDLRASSGRCPECGLPMPTA